MKRTFWLLACAAVGTTACTDAAPPNAVAVAGDQVLTVEKIVSYLVDESQIPAERDFLAQLAELWVDYSLLASTAASDSALGALDLTSVVTPQVERELVQTLSAQAIQVDTAIAEDELMRMYNEELPGARVRASHILLQFDRQRQESQDSALALARALKQRLQAGERFADLARTYSTDQGSAATGGDLGFFDRETMVAPFADAAFSLEPGVVSEPVLTDFGVHLIRVSDRQVMAFDSIQDAYANAVKNRRVAQAVEAFMTKLEEDASLEEQEGALEAVRTLTEAVPDPLSDREARQVLVRYDGGELSLGDLQAFFLTQPRGLWAQTASAPDEAISVLLARVTRSKLLVEEARARGIEVTAGRTDTLTMDARVQLVDAANVLGLRNLAPAGSTATPAVVGAAVDSSLVRIVRGEGEFVELSALSLTLREPTGARVIDAGVDRALEALREERRSRAPASATTGEAGVAPPTLTPPDSSPPSGNE